MGVKEKRAFRETRKKKYIIHGHRKNVQKKNKERFFSYFPIMSIKNNEFSNQLN
jgi:hypothetical protein